VANATQLQHLDVSGTEVSGDVRELNNSNELRYLHLSGTKISGALVHWKEIQDLQLSGTKVQIFGASFLDGFWPRDDQGKWICPFLSLKSFDVSGTPLSTTVEKLLRPFLGCRALEAFKAAECNLTGGIPSRLQVDSQGSFRDEWPVSQVLRVLDLASNHVTSVEALPPKCQAVTLAGNPSIEFEAGVLEKAVSNKVALDLRNVWFANKSEANHVLDTGVVKPNYNERTVVDQLRGFACFDFVNTLIQISPEKFAPEKLCACSPGWTGSGAQCEKCDRDSFKEGFLSKQCTPCPSGSWAPEGSTSMIDCKCQAGQLYNSTGQWKCGCREDLAYLAGACVHCSPLHLSCPGVGSNARSAMPMTGYIRLGKEIHARKCLEPDSRCDAKYAESDASTALNATQDVGTTDYNYCSKGYKGTMCMECEANYFATRKTCEKCADATTFSIALLIVVGVIVVLAAVGVGIWLWMRRSTQAEVQLKEQLKAQVPILLQLCQLWAVLAPKNGTGGAFWEVPYVEALQLSVGSFKSAFNLLNLQCRFDGRMVRFLFASIAPVLPLAVTLCCLLLEFVKPGFGIMAGLQALTLLYIGGAYSTSSLSSCQEVDGDGAELPKDFIFRKSMPYIFCHREIQEESDLRNFVDRFAVFCVICYAIVIPCCLLYLYGKQHVALQVGRTTTVAGQQQGDLTLSLSEVLGSTQKTSQKDQDIRRLVAATAGYISVLYHGRVQVRVAGGTVFVKRLGECRDSEVNLEAELLSFIHGEDVKLRERQLKCRSLSEMLMERVILEEIPPNDRIMSGMKRLLVKYSLCRNVWMEIVQKLVAMLLVSVVETEKALQFSLGITLTMAATSAMVQPYAQPQANRLHFYSFICLALAAASFHYNLAWPARAALAVPFMVTAAQAFKPDNSESLALRLWEELEPQMETLQRGEPVEIVAETYNFR